MFNDGGDGNLVITEANPKINLLLLSALSACNSVSNSSELTCMIHYLDEK